jgi:uncharacterized protein (DUF1697 family)
MRSVYISMLRGVNVSGQRKLRMETLREIYQRAGFCNVRTYVQSGNVVFEGPEKEPSMLTKDIEASIQQTCGYRVEVFIRLTSEFKQILEGNPFIRDRKEASSKLHVTFLYQPPTVAAWRKLTVPAGTLDEFLPGERAIYLYCPNGYGKTKLSNNFFERKLGVPATTRNWNTINALYKLTLVRDSTPT